MSGIFDQIINYSPPLIVSGTVNYKGTWNASTNNPTLNVSPPSSTKGDYYVVSTAGTQFGISFAIGDWIISNGTAWEKVDLTDAVSSVFGRTGAVVGVSTDYSAVGITNTAIGASNPSTGAFTTVSATTPIAGTSGGTGVNNGVNTITIAGNVTHAGAFTQSFTATANTALTLPTTGTLATLAGSEALSNKTITASSFSGTTLTASSTVTLSGGTASGVAYLNGSNALTTGSALTFDGNNFSQSGSNAAVSLLVNTTNAGVSASNYSEIQLADTGTVRSYWRNLRDGSGATIFSGNDHIRYALLGSEKMRLSSTGLAVTGNGAFTSSSTNSAEVGIVNTSTGGRNYALVSWGSAAGGGALTGKFSIFDNTAGAHRFVIDSSGNVGINTSSPGTTLDVQAANASLRVYGTGASDTPQFQLRNGSQIWQQIVDGADSNKWKLRTGAGATVLTCDTNGNVGIGASSPAGKLDVQAASGSGLTAYFRGGTYSDIAYSTGVRFVAPASTSNANRQFKFQSGDSSLTIQGIDGSGSNASDTSLSLQPSGGNVGIGQATPSYRLDVIDNSIGIQQRLYSSSVNGCALLLTSASTNGRSYRIGSNFINGLGEFGLYDDNAGATRILVSSAGNVTIGSSSVDANYKLLISNSGAGINIVTSTSSQVSARFQTSSGLAGYIDSTGTSTNYATSSDYRLKENLIPLSGSGVFIDALKPKSGTWKADGSKFVGFLAHEFAEVCPSAVRGEKDAVDENGEPIYQGMQASTSEVIANLVAELQSVRQRLAALESN